MTAQETEKRKKRKSGLPTFNSDEFNQQDKEDYERIKKAYDAGKSFIEDTNKQIERKADELSKRYHDEFEQNHSYSECNCHKISEEMRKKCREIMGTEPNIKQLLNYISDVLGEYKDGMYVRKYDKQTLHNEDAMMHPYFDTDVKTQKLSEFLVEIERTNKHDRFSLSRNGRTDLSTRLSKIAKEYKENCDKDKIPFSNDERSLEDLFHEEKTSLDIAELPEDEQIRLIQKLQGDEYDALITQMTKLRDSVTKENFISDNPRVGECILNELLKMNTRLLDRSIEYYRIYHLLTPQQRQSAITKFTLEVFALSRDYDGALAQNFEDKEQGYRAKRSFDLHDKLSDSA